LFVSFLLAVLAGCTPARVREADRSVGLYHLEPWQFENQPGRVMVTPHYRIHVTLKEGNEEGDLNDASAGQLAVLMESAYEQYRKLLPDVSPSERPLECFVFASRRDWARFTAKHAGKNAAIYLQIQRGGYTQGDVFVAFWVGPDSTRSLAAHEGWHQFAGRHFVGRIPPALEEGLACLFEQQRWEDGRPIFSIESNTRRARAVALLIYEKRLLPLAELVTLHAGQVVESKVIGTEGWYGQVWALASFLRDGDGGAHRAGLQNLLNDAAAGTIFDPTGTHQRVDIAWDSRGVVPMFEHYFGMPIDRLDRAFRAYMKQFETE